MGLFGEKVDERNWELGLHFNGYSTQDVDVNISGISLIRNFPLRMGLGFYAIPSLEAICQNTVLDDIGLQQKYKYDTVFLNPSFSIKWFLKNFFINFRVSQEIAVSSYDKQFTQINWPENSGNYIGVSLGFCVDKSH